RYLGVFPGLYLSGKRARYSPKSRDLVFSLSGLPFVPEDGCGDISMFREFPKHRNECSLSDTSTFPEFRKRGRKSPKETA
ncbi:hypothetical protein, partial [Salmonella sp. SAL4432]|uniref:hypothetical protein n=1 Tax=Salmonella sp. SAL4432 TaxID=3159887 RepID=UPI00397C259C